jgi:hypothetical protein
VLPQKNVVHYITLHSFFLEVSWAELMFLVWISEYRGMGWKEEFKRIAVVICSVWAAM